MEISDTRYGHRKARAFAQQEANRVGRKVYLQLDRLCGRDKFLVLVATVGRGPIFLGAPWREFYPE